MPKEKQMLVDSPQKVQRSGYPVAPAEARSRTALRQQWGIGLAIAAYLAASPLVATSAWSQALAQKSSADRVNEIINNFSEDPRTRGRTRGVTRGAKLDASLVCERAIQRATRSTRASKKDLADVRDCVADNPRMDFRVNFAYNSTAIDKSAKRILDELGSALESEQLAEASFIVAGHTDRSGGAGYNLELSKRRAEAVRRYLVENFRVKGTQLIPIGYGFEHLANPRNPLGEENRRVEIVRQ
jgi:outer membrane protein OmpA-like peptidoglycan-associated protein